MPIKDYFEVQEVEEEVLTEDAKHAKVIEFVYQVRQRDIHGSASVIFFVGIQLHIINAIFNLSR